MSEITTVSSRAEANQNYASLVQIGLETANQLGFDLMQSVTENRIDKRSLGPERTALVLGKTIEIAHELQLEPTFFDRPVNTILLTAIADSWIDTDEKAGLATSYDQQIADERAMLVDSACILAGDHSNKVKTIAEKNPYYADRYVAPAVDPDQVARKAFYESINDTALAERVTTVLNQEGEGSFLQEQRAILGITTANQDPLEVKVLKTVDNRNLKTFGFFDGQDLSDEQIKQVTKEYADNTEEYNHRFAEKFGPSGTAFINRNPDGSSTLYLQALDAQSLLSYFTNGQPLPPSLAPEDLDKQFAIVRHEYTHTQKFMPIGPHQQLGLSVEERRAELLSGDKMGYQDVKQLFTDVLIASSVDLVKELGEAAKTDDIASNFVVKSANKLGLRHTLLMFLDKPRGYDTQSEDAKKFVDLHCVKEASDISTHDVIVRELLSNRGEAMARDKLVKWASELVTQDSFAYLRDDYTSMRKREGSGHMSNLMQEVLDKVDEDHKKAV